MIDKRKANIDKLYKNSLEQKKDKNLFIYIRFEKKILFYTLREIAYANIFPFPCFLLLS